MSVCLLICGSVVQGFRFSGFKVSGFMVSGFEGFSVSGFQGFKVGGFEGFQGVRAPGLQGFSVSGFQLIRCHESICMYLCVFVCIVCKRAYGMNRISKYCKLVGE